MPPSCQCWDPIWLDPMLAGSIPAATTSVSHVCISPRVSERCSFLGVMHWLWLSDHGGQVFDDAISFRSECSKVSPHCALSIVGLCVNSHLLQEEASVMLGGQGPDIVQ